MCLLKDGVLALFAIQVREYLDFQCQAPWIGSNEMAPRSPDLTTPDNLLWGIIKSDVFRQLNRTNEKLCESVEQAFGNITLLMPHDMSKRTW